MSRQRIGIVGAGPGGLLTAYLLEGLCGESVSIELFEKSSRVGGKILTPTFSKAPVSYEAGAAEFYDYSPAGEDPLRELIVSLGLPISTMGGSAVVLREGTIASLDDLAARLGESAAAEVREFDRRARDRIPPPEFYAADERGIDGPADRAGEFARLLDRELTGAGRRYVETMIHSDLATEPSRTSITYGLQNYLMNDGAYLRLYGIVGGNRRLIDELALRLAARIRLETPVTAIGTASGRSMLEYVANGSTRRESFDAIVIALPHDALGEVEFRGERLASAMWTHRARYDHPAHYLRITLLFDRPFWSGRLLDSYCMLEAFGGCCLYDESSRIPESRYGVLGWLLGGDAALTRVDASDQELIAAALASLPSDWPDGSHHLLEGRVHRWIGAVNALPGGEQPQSLDLRHRPEPIEHPRLFVVGDYLFDSTLNGVLDSAEYVAGWIASLVSDLVSQP